MKGFNCCFFLSANSEVHLLAVLTCSHLFCIRRHSCSVDIVGFVSYQSIGVRW